MGARDRPFPPGGLPYEEAKLYKMAFDLAYRKEYVTEAYGVDGQGMQLAVRKLGGFEIHVEFQITVPQNIIRFTVMIWYEEHLVFNAWCSRIAESGETVGLVVTCEDGPWKAHLRRRSESEEKA
ncbi:MAG: hypothetical protein AAB554_02030 [Patescibacteria group bacterium]